MAKRKRISKQKRINRRLREAQKAQRVRSARGTKASVPKVATEGMKSKGRSETKFVLPVREIKRDLIKVIVFAVVSVAFLLTLKQWGNKII